MGEYKTIYLQSGYLQQRPDDDEIWETTWCQDKINDDDTEYILKSEYDALQAKLDIVVEAFNRIQRRFEGSIDFVEAGSSATGTKMYLALSAISGIVEEVLAELDGGE